MTKHRDERQTIAAISAAINRLEKRMTKLDDKITALQGNLDTLSSTVTEVVADIVTLKGQIGAGEVVTQAQLDSLDAISGKLTGATTALKAGE